MIAKKKVGVIGGGIVGAAVAYNLSLYDFIDVTLFEKDQIGSGTTAKSAGTVCLFDDSLPYHPNPFRFFRIRVDWVEVLPESVFRIAVFRILAFENLRAASRIDRKERITLRGDREAIYLSPLLL